MEDDSTGALFFQTSNPRFGGSGSEYVAPTEFDKNSSMSKAASYVRAPPDINFGRGGWDDEDGFEEVDTDIIKSIPREHKGESPRFGGSKSQPSWSFMTDDTLSQPGMFELDNAGLEDEDAAFAPMTQNEPAQIHPAAEKRLRALLAKIEGYKGRLKDMNARFQQAKERGDKMAAELAEAKEELQQAELKSQSRLVLSGVKGKDRGREEEEARRRAEARKQMFTGMAGEMLGGGGELEEIGANWLALGKGEVSLKEVVKKTLGKMLLWLKARYPLRKAVKSVEAHYGSSVAAYFSFFRWMVLNSLLLATAASVALALHISSLAENGQLQLINGTANVTLGCADGFNGCATRTVNWTTLIGFLPEFLQYSSYGPSEALAYSVTLFGCLLLLALLALLKWVGEDRRNKTMEAFDESGMALPGQSGNAKYALLALNAWDFSVQSAEEVEDLKLNNGLQMATAIHEDSLKLKSATLSRGDRVKLYARRAVGFLLYMVVQAAGWGVILTLTAQSQTLEAAIQAQVGVQLPIAVVPIVVTLINAALPKVITFIVNMEQWENAGSKTKQILARLFFAKIFNVLIQVFSFMLLGDPHLFTDSGSLFGLPRHTIRASSEKQYRSSFGCRLNQVGQQMFILVLTEFLLSKLLAVGMPIAKRVVAKLRGKPPKRGEFEVALKMISLLYFHSLFLMSFPFFPSAAIFMALFHLLNFHFDLFVLHRFQQKPRNPWSARDAGGFFIKFYIYTLVLGIAGTHLVLTNRTFPKMCAQQLASLPYTTDGAIPDGKPSFYGPSGVYANLGTSAACAVTTEGYRPLPDYLPSSVVEDAWCVCRDVCGPFAFSSSGYAPIVTWALSTPVVDVLFQLAVQNTLFVWGLFSASVIAYSFHNNSLSVARDLALDTDLSWRQLYETMQKRIERQNRELRVLKHNNVTRSTAPAAAAAASAASAAR